MSDEAQKVSVEIPSEVLKEVSAAVENAKASSTDNNTLVTLHFSREAASSLVRLRENMTAFDE